MKTFDKIISALLVGSAITANAMDENGWASIYESLAAFDKNIPVYGNRSGYVKPIINNLGNVLNSNWYVSASVPQSPAFEAGLPFSLIPIGDDDKNFKETWMGLPMENPTIFGDHHDMTQPYDGRVYGNETLNGLGVFTYPYLQLGGSMFHARAVVRMMWLPAISELQGFSLFGFGLQYSFGHLFQYMLPPAAQGLDVSLVFGYNSSSIGYQPEDYKGQLDLDISATTFDLVIGYKPFNFIEVMMTLGYQSASMESSGNLYQSAGKDAFGQDIKTNEIHPNLSVDGNCGFKFGLAVAFQLGSSYHPVVGFDYAGKSSYTTNVLYFKQQFGTDKTPDEIAKEKGYVRGAKSNEQDEAAKAAAEQKAKEDSLRNEADESYDELD